MRVFAVCSPISPPPPNAYQLSRDSSSPQMGVSKPFHFRSLLTFAKRRRIIALRIRSDLLMTLGGIFSTLRGAQ